MIATALTDNLAVAGLASMIGGVFTLTGMFVASRIMRRDVRSEDDRTWRREQDQERFQRIESKLDVLGGKVDNGVERIAGMEAVFKLAIPWLRDHDANAS